MILRLLLFCYVSGYHYFYALAERLFVQYNVADAIPEQAKTNDVKRYENSQVVVIGFGRPSGATRAPFYLWA